MIAPDRADDCEIRLVNEANVNRARQLLRDDEVYVQLADTFHALADSNRAKIVYCLLHQELCVCDLATVVGVSESAVSQHLRILRMLRLVKSRREGKMVYYSLSDEHIRTLLDVCLEHLGHE